MQKKVPIVSELPRFTWEGGKLSSPAPTPLVGPTTLQILAMPLPTLLSWISVTNMNSQLTKLEIIFTG